MSERLYERVLDSRTYYFEDPQRKNKYAAVEEYVEIIEVDHQQDERLKGRTTQIKVEQDEPIAQQGWLWGCCGFLSENKPKEKPKKIIEKKLQDEPYISPLRTEERQKMPWVVVTHRNQNHISTRRS